VERCGALLHLVDATAEDVGGDWRTIEAEIDAYGHGLADKPRILALSKTDALDAKGLTAARAALAEAGAPPALALSSASGAGVREALRALRDAAAARREQAARADAPDQPWKP
jgi:GTP-binding protein